MPQLDAKAVEMAIPRKITENFIATSVDDEVVLIDMAGGELFSLKGTARAIWEAIDGKRGLEDIGRLMEREYDVQSGDALAGVGSLVAELKSAKLLKL